MFNKNNFYFLCLVDALVCPSLIYAATPMETLATVKEGLIAGQEQVAKAVIKLTGAYSNTQVKVLNKLQSARDDLNGTVSLLKTVDEYSRWVMVGLAAVVAGGSAAGAAIGAVTFGVGAVAIGIVVVACAVAIPLLVDVPEIVTGLLATLSSIQSLLDTIKGNIQPKNDLLKPGSARITAWFDKRVKTIQEQITKAIAAAQTQKPVDLGAIKDNIMELQGLMKAAGGLSKDTLTAIDNTFSGVSGADTTALQNGLNAVINQFNAIKGSIAAENGDTRGVYAYLEKSNEKFGEAVATVDKIIIGLQKTAAGIRGKPKPAIQMEEVEE